MTGPSTTRPAVEQGTPSGRGVPLTELVRSLQTSPVTGRAAGTVVGTADDGTVEARRADGQGLAPEQVDGLLVTGATLDSRAARPGDLYAALPGARAHGADFAADAVASGAVAVLTDAEGAARLVQASRAGRAGLRPEVPVVVVPDPRAVLGDVAARIHRSGAHAPDRRPLLLGVTGTNGKTTTTYLLEGALRATGRTTGLVGTVETRVAGEVQASVRTTPEAPALHALLRLMADRGVDAAAFEVSSHALALHRVDGVVFDVAAFTNLSQDHLDFHPTLEDYFAAKASLFTPARARRGVVCVDDAWGRHLAATAGVPVVTVATTGTADWTVGDVVPDPAGTSFTLRRAAGPVGDAATEAPGAADRLRLRAPLPGAFNVANTAVAAVVLLEAGLEPEEVVRGLAASGGVPGRMERVEPPPGRAATALPRVVVDYAHTPDAVAAALSALRGSTPGRLVAVLGAGGDRDRGKRAAMGRQAAAHADVVVVTDDNPRSEDPADIRAAVLAGARSAGTAAEIHEVAGRAAAIAQAVAAAGAGGTVLVAGKGHERGQEVAGTVHPFDDRVQARTALEALAAPTSSDRTARTEDS